MPSSSEPVPRALAVSAFTPKEAAQVLEAANQMVWNRRVRVQRKENGAIVAGFDCIEDATFVSHTVQLLLATGIHISLLPTLTAAALHMENGLPHLRWRRQRSGSEEDAPLPRSMGAWLPSYLALPKPKTQAAYFQMLDRLADETERLFGTRIHCAPLRFRHTARSVRKERSAPPFPATASSQQATHRRAG